MKTNNNIFYLVLVGGFLQACSSADLTDALPDNRPNYKQSRVTNSLEIPPDLTQSSLDDSLQVPELKGIDNATLATYQNERQSGSKAQLAKTLKNIHSDGTSTWIEISAPPDVVFANAKRFWQDNGLPLQRVDEALGIMETDWLEASNDMPAGSALGSLLSGLLNVVRDDGKRDKFRTRIDYDGTVTKVYLTHYGATEEQLNDLGKVKKSVGNDKDAVTYAWVADDRNPELEIEMLRRLNLYLHSRGKTTANTSETASTAGQAPANSTAISFTHLSDGTPVLVIGGNFERAWTLTGIAIDRAGYDLTKQDRSNGTYHFNKVTTSKSGFIFKTSTQTTEAFTLGLSDQGDKQIVVVRSYNGKRPSSVEAKTVLQRLSKSIGTQ